MSTRTTGPGPWRRLAVATAAIAFVAFLPVLGNGFVPTWDDRPNFLENFAYRGLGLENLRWAWGSVLLGVYQPLAWMILEAEYAAWGLDPRGYHLVSLLWHAANAAVLLRLTLALLDRVDRSSDALTEVRRVLPMASALAVVLFAVHPLRVEVVAWASCQPYLPCALFSMLAVLAYLAASDAGRPRGRAGWLAAAWLLLLAALLCKAVAVTIPVVLRILDVYPLRRVRSGSRALWVEKLPFFALSLAFVALGMHAKGRYTSPHSVPPSLSSCLAQAGSAIVLYALKTIAPFGLAAYYPMPKGLSLHDRAALLCLFVVVAATATAWSLRRRLPGLLATWACTLVLLLPNLGFVRVGNKIAADRYTYLASMPGAVALAYVLGRLARRPRSWRWTLAVALAMIVGLLVLDGKQCLTWRTSEALWTQALRQGGRGDATIQNNLGRAMEESGRLAEAGACFVRALEADPEDEHAAINLGGLALDRGRLDDAERWYRKALALKPDSDEAMTGLGLALDQQGRSEDAERWYRRSLRVNPASSLTHNDLGVALARRGDPLRAIDQFAQAVGINPDYPEALSNLGRSLADQGKDREALIHLSRAIRLKPGYANAHAGMGTALGHLGRDREAAAAFEAALRVEPDHRAARQGLDQLRERQGRRDGPPAR